MKTTFKVIADSGEEKQIETAAIDGVFEKYSINVESFYVDPIEYKVTIIVEPLELTPTQ